MFYVFDILAATANRLRREDGQAMTEYAVLIAVIALIVVVAAIVLGEHISTLVAGPPKSH
jgi:Flp pilus assembly pilin Flp